jgi:hypothetical protein
VANGGARDRKVHEKSRRVGTSRKADGAELLPYLQARGEIIYIGVLTVTRLIVINRVIDRSKESEGRKWGTELKQFAMTREGWNEKTKRRRNRGGVQQLVIRMEEGMHYDSSFFCACP